MNQYLGVSIALIVFMGLVSGGMLTLVLMTTRKYQASFSLILALAGLLALAGVFASVADIDQIHEGLANALVILILSFALGYTLTTFSVLSYSHRLKHPTAAASPRNENTAVILLAPGEPPQYDVKSASKRLAFADDPQDVPPVLLRPFLLRDLRSKYAAIGRSPYKDYHMKLAQKVQSRLDNTHRVYPAFYSDEPTLAEAVAEAVAGGTRRVIIAHTRVSIPPDPIKSGELIEGLGLEKQGVSMVEVGPLWDAELLPQLYVRRVLETVPQLEIGPESIGLLLIGRGHSTPDGADARAPLSSRQEQEEHFQKRVRQALLKVGFSESRVAYAWLRDQKPSIVEAFNALMGSGCKAILWMPCTFPADGISTLYDIAALLDPIARKHGIRSASLGAWNADDLAAEEIATRVRAAGVGAGQTTTARAF